MLSHLILFSVSLERQSNDYQISMNPEKKKKPGMKKYYYRILFARMSMQHLGRNYNHTRTVRTMRKIWQDRSHSLYSRFSLPLWSQKDLEISYLPWCKYVFPFYNTCGFIFNNMQYCGTFLLILCIITIKTVELQRKKERNYVLLRRDELVLKFPFTQTIVALMHTARKRKTNHHQHQSLVQWATNSIKRITI